MKILVLILDDDGGAILEREYSPKIIKELVPRKSVLLPDDFKDEIEELAAEAINRKF